MLPRITVASAGPTFRNLHLTSEFPGAREPPTVGHGNRENAMHPVTTVVFVRRDSKIVIEGQHMLIRSDASALLEVHPVNAPRTSSRKKRTIGTLVQPLLNARHTR